MTKPHLQLFSDAELKWPYGTVICPSCEDINGENTIRQPCEHFKVITHTPTDQHLAEGICMILKNLASHISCPSTDVDDWWRPWDVIASLSPRVWFETPSRSRLRRASMAPHHERGSETRDRLRSQHTSKAPSHEREHRDTTHPVRGEERIETQSVEAASRTTLRDRRYIAEHTSITRQPPAPPTAHTPVPAPPACS